MKGQPELRTRVMAAALRVMFQAQKEATAIAEITQEANVAHEAFRSEFPVMEDLLEALWEEKVRHSFLKIQNVCLGLKDPMLRLASSIRLILSMAQRDTEWGRLILMLCDNSTNIGAKIRAHLTLDVEDGGKEIPLATADSTYAADFVAGAVCSALKMVVSECHGPTYVDETCEMVLLALGAEQPGAKLLSRSWLPAIGD